MKPIYTFRASTDLERTRRRDILHQEYWQWSAAAILILGWLVLGRIF